MEFQDMLNKIRNSARERILILPHAINQISRPERMILIEEIERTIFHGEVIEDYPEDVRGHSCLMLGYGKDKRPVHVICSPKIDYLAIITAYLPNQKDWSDDYKTRI